MTEPPCLTDDELAALGFEEAQALLEQVVTELENGRLPLEQSLALYQHGLRLRDHCRRRLETAEAVLERLRDNGTLAVEEEQAWE
ncbi:MAG: exodeoxyribonuclease VII small subunit [Armatimonadetes bacterium]|nr:exodeoxyribonuclease VII small subunit [Armatimonadota bacterium]